jgi:hypothetical protein
VVTTVNGSLVTYNCLLMNDRHDYAGNDDDGDHAMSNVSSGPLDRMSPPAATVDKPYL